MARREILDKKHYQQLVHKFMNESETMEDRNLWEHLYQVYYCEAEKASKSPVTVYFDMDGVLAKWQTTKADGSPIVFDEDILPEHKHYYRTIPPNKKMCDLVNELCKDENYDIHILSKSMCGGIRDKYMWLKTYIPNLPLSDVILVPYTQDAEKSNFIPYINDNVILFDDYTPNQVEFEQSGGISVNALNGINRYDSRFFNYDCENPSLESFKNLMDEIFNKQKPIPNEFVHGKKKEKDVDMQSLRCKENNEIEPPSFEEHDL